MAVPGSTIFSVFIVQQHSVIPTSSGGDYRHSSYDAISHPLDTNMEPVVIIKVFINDLDMLHGFIYPIEEI